ncbi:DUF6090 family protein [Winogradskyella aurantia]|nr:DUF6090 family protein [Winogradskyella aurantia]
MEKNKTGKYLKYVIGEIILVVIGILIALWINNLNEQRKQNNEYQSILKTVKNDMMIDTMNMGLIIRRYKQNESSFLLSMKDTITKEEYLECKKCPMILSSFSPVFLQTNGINRIQVYNNKDESEKDSLNFKIQTFYSQVVPSLDNAVTSTTALLQEYTQLFRESKPWFKNWYKGKYDDDFYDYVLNDPIYKNRVAQYYTYIYKYYLLVLNVTIEEEEKLLQLIDTRLKPQNK